MGCPRALCFAMIPSMTSDELLHPSEPQFPLLKAKAKQTPLPLGVTGPSLPGLYKHLEPMAGGA